MRIKASLASNTGSYSTQRWLCVFLAFAAFGTRVAVGAAFDFAFDFGNSKDDVGRVIAPHIHHGD
jgi:hypothetical protein